MLTVYTMKFYLKLTNIQWGEKMSKIQTEKKMPWMIYVGLVLGGIAALMLTTLFPVWHWFPVQITEQGKVIAITEKGCVVEVQTIDMPIITQCNAKPGDVIQVTYYVPAKVTSGYYDRVQEKAALIQP